MDNERKPIPAALRRKVFVKSGHQCSIPFCGEKSDLEVHHINGNPSDNRESNLIVLCPNHHAMADRGRIDRKSCKAYNDRLEELEYLRKSDNSLNNNKEINGLDVEPDPLLVKAILALGRRYMIWKYGKPDASMKIEIGALGIISIVSFIPIIYEPFFLKTTEFSITTLDIVSAFFGFTLLIILMVTFNRRCTKCGGYFGIERINSKLLDEKELLRTDDYIKMRKIFYNTYSCAICNNQYTKTEHDDYSVKLSTSNKEDDYFL